VSTPARNFFFEAGAAGLRRTATATAARWRLPKRPTRTKDMRLKKNIGKTRFFFLATARGAFADDHATIA
jgi:hypothetical protein